MRGIKIGNNSVNTNLLNKTNTMVFFLSALSSEWQWNYLLHTISCQTVLKVYIKLFYLTFVGGRYSAVRVVTKLRPGSPRNLGSIPCNDKRFLSLFQGVQPECGVQPAPYWVSTGASFARDHLRMKWPQHEPVHSLKSSAEVRNEWSYTSLFSYVWH
jgi:hypothetical protein